MRTQLVVSAYIFDKDKVLLIHHKKLDKWLPVGGHVEDNESSDDAILREIREEVGLEVELLNIPQMPIKGNTISILAIPFHVNVHNVGDHDHCSFYYLAKALNPEKLKINRELNNFLWITKEEIEQKPIPEDVKDQLRIVFDKITNYQ